MRLSIRAKIVLISGAILFLAIGANTVINSRIFVREYSAVLESNILIVAKTFRSHIDRLLKLQVPLRYIMGLDKECLEIVAHNDFISYASVVDLNGKILFHNAPEMHGQIVNMPAHKKKAPIFDITETGSDDPQYYNMMLPIIGLNSDLIAYIRLGYPVSLVSQKTERLIANSVSITILFLCLGIISLILLLNLWVTNPLAKLVSVIQEIRKKGAGGAAPVQIDTNDEIGDLALTFNQMIAELNAAQQKIKNHSRELQIKVEARTAELKEANERLQEDIEKRKQMEAQLVQAQKMRAIGTLAGGVAHDFNNLLTTIMGNADLVYSALPKDDPLREDMHEIKKASEKAAALTAQLLSFSRGQTIKPQVLDLNHQVKDMQKMLLRITGEEVQLSTHLAPDLWPVQADAGQFNQVIINLVINAREAMPKGGRLLIETANLPPESPILAEADLQKEQVLLSVSDTGTGIDAQVLPRIFDPFFTTKGVGRGSGLGLSTAYGIINQNKGQIRVKSKPGEGTTFFILLPKAASATADSDPSIPESDPRGGETVLLVEDDNAVRGLAVHVLESYGYAVLEAGSGEEALSLSHSHPDRIDLMLTDVSMPGMSGLDLAKKIEPLQPGIRILYMSGYDNALDTIVCNGDAAPPFLKKPFSPQTLINSVRSVLDQTAAKMSKGGKG